MSSKLSLRSRVLVFDVESNGLHGDGFAVGAVVINLESGEILDRFEARANIPGEVDSWVAENVLPNLEGMDITHDNLTDLRTAFWTWFQTAKEDSLIFADVGVPVESRFLAACIDDAVEERQWGGPYPLHEVATILLAAGENPDVNREEYVADEITDRTVRKHHPTWDSEVSALSLRKASMKLK